MADAAGSPVSGSAFPDELDDGLVKEPITEAVMSNRVERVQQLLSVDPEKIGMRKPTYYGRTLLMLAAEEGHMDVARLLVERGADPNAVDDQENTALHCAALAGRVDLLAYLLGLGVDPIAQNNLGRTALMRAAWGGHVPVIEALIAHPEPVGLNMQDAQGATALHWACKWGHKAVVRLLIAHGVRQDTRDKEGRLASEILERTQLVRPDSHCEWFETHLSVPFNLYRARREVVASASEPLIRVPPLPNAVRRRFLVRPLPTIDVLPALRHDATGQVSAPSRKRLVEERIDEGELAERDATVDYVLRDMPAELFVELLMGFRDEDDARRDGEVRQRATNARREAHTQWANAIGAGDANQGEGGGGGGANANQGGGDANADGNVSDEEESGEE